ncbi:MAG: hypothetical protein COA61_001390 [Zetaproteobacteria bacterium]|nr:hypothetical protein [Zetaproteobacteria bacterium]
MIVGIFFTKVHANVHIYTGVYLAFIIADERRRRMNQDATPEKPNIEGFDEQLDLSAKKLGLN